MTEERKYAILFAATLPSARKLMPMLEDETPNMAQEFWTEHYVKRAIEQAARILEKIDECWPTAEKVVTVNRDGPKNTQRVGIRRVRDSTFSATVDQSVPRV